MATIRITTGTTIIEKRCNSGYDEASRVVRAIVSTVDALDALGVHSYGEDLRATLIAALSHPAPPRVEHAPPENADSPSINPRRAYHRRKPIEPLNSTSQEAPGSIRTRPLDSQHLPNSILAGGTEGSIETAIDPVIEPFKPRVAS